MTKQHIALFLFVTNLAPALPIIFPHAPEVSFPSDIALGCCLEEEMVNSAFVENL